MIITIAALKGGTGKTTTAVMLAAAFARKTDTLLIDTDSQPAGTAQDWADVDGFPVPTVGVAKASKNATEILRLAEGRDIVVIDTPPAHSDVTRTALSVSDAVIVPTAPTRADVSQLSELFALIEAVRLNENPDLLGPWVLLNKGHRGRRSLRDTRQLLKENQITVLNSEVHHREALGLAYGATIKSKMLDLYYEPLRKEVLRKGNA